MRILITGATGTVGSAVITTLLGGAHPPIAALRDPSEGDRLPPEVEVRRLDFMDPTTYAAALAGIDGLFLIRPPAISDSKRYINPVVDAAERAGVQRIAFLSVLGAERNPLLPHRATEKRLERSAIASTLLRASNFMQNFAAQNAAEIREEDAVYVPSGAGKTGFIDARDVAEVAAEVLTRDLPMPPALDLTGPAALSGEDVAAALSQALGRPITYARPGALAFVRRKLADGEKLPYVLVMTALYTVARLGLAQRTTDEVVRILSRPPRTFLTFATDYAATWSREAS